MLIGNKIKITEAKNKSLVGIEGKVIDETKNLFIIEGKTKNKTKIRKIVKESIKFKILKK